MPTRYTTHITAMPMVLGTLFYSPAYGAVATPAEQADLFYAREAGKVARDTFLVLFDLWNLPVFASVAGSKQMHMDAMLKVLLRYDLPDPAANHGIGEFTNEMLQALYRTLIASGRLSGLDALEAGGVIEEIEIRDTQSAVERTRYDDIKTVFATLMRGSRNHLRSFAQTIEALTGQPYVAKVLPQETVNAVLQGPMENLAREKRPPGLHIRTNAA